MKTRLLLGGLFVTLAAGSAWAQAAAGLAGISGTVRDATGSVIPAAQVEIDNPSKGVHISLNSSDGGVFNAPALTPASGYSVTVSKSGFAKYEVKDIDLAVGENLDIAASLAIASTATQVDVVAATPLVESTKTDVSGVIGEQQILDLPINGRRVDSFVLLTPGVTNDGNFGLLSFRGVANGNTFLLDGNDSTEEFYVENNGRTRITSQISQDAVQEFQVVSEGFSAEYGRAMGGVVNTVTRSGSNDLHGTAYWFFRNQDFIAHDPYANINPDEWRLQAGASVGGAIKKNKLFYFFNAEFNRRNAPLVDSYIKAGIIDPVNQVFLGCASPATPAQCSAVNTLLPRFFGQVARTVAQDLGFGRLDYHLNDRNTFSASLNFMHFTSPNGLQQTLISSTTGAGVNSNGNDYGRVRNGKLNWTSVGSSNFVNEFRYGWNTDLEGDTLNPALNGILGSLDVSAAAVTLGAINYLPRVEPNETRNEFSDNASWVKGKHIVKFGADIATTNDYSYFIQNVNGNYTYQTITKFAQDFSGNTAGAKNWQSFSQTFGDAHLNTRLNDYGFYVEDQWRATKALTVNAGLRYEYTGIPQPTVCSTIYAQTCHIYSKPTNFMPRIGLAYKLDDKTVVRAGYGMYYARVAGATLQDMFVGNGVVSQSLSLAATQAPQLAAGPVFPNILGAPPPGINLAANSFQFAAPNWKTPYSEQMQFGIERQLMHDLVLTTSFIFSRGVQLYSVRDLNLPTGSTNFTYQIGDAKGVPTGETYTTSVVTGSRPDPRFGGIYQDENGVTSKYTAFVAQLNKRFSHGFQGLISYTWSHEVDDGQSYGQSTNNLYLSNSFGWLTNGNYKADMGDGLEDQPNRLAVSWIWAPHVGGTSAVSKYVLNGWQLSSITTIGSSRPYGSPTVRLNDTPVPGMFSNFSLNGTGFSGRVPFWAVNSVWQPALYRADARLSKVIPIGEKYKVFLNFEAFNISNSWSPTSMTAQAFTEAKGILTLTPAAYNVGSGDAASPDGTEARRLQVSARFTF